MCIYSKKLDKQEIIQSFAKRLMEGENAKVRHLYQWGEEGPTTECCPDCPACAVLKEVAAMKREEK